MNKLNEFQSNAVNIYLKKRKSIYYRDYEFKEDMIEFNIDSLNITIMINLSKMEKDNKLVVKNITDCIKDVIKIIGKNPKTNSLTINNEQTCICDLAHYPYLDWKF